MANQDIKVNDLYVNIQTWITSTRYRVCEHAQVIVEHVNRDMVECEGRDYWYNRPWYTFKYQNALMYGARHAYDMLSHDIKYDYMTERGWKRITAKRAPEINGYIERKMYNTPAEVLLYLIENHDKLAHGAGYREYDICYHLDHIEAYMDGSHPLIKFTDEAGNACTWDRSTNTFVN